jgi:hypothetical protein
VADRDQVADVPLDALAWRADARVRQRREAERAGWPAPVG